VFNALSGTVKIQGILKIRAFSHFSQKGSARTVSVTVVVKRHAPEFLHFTITLEEKQSQHNHESVPFSEGPWHDSGRLCCWISVKMYCSSWITFLSMKVHKQGRLAVVSHAPSIVYLAVSTHRSRDYRRALTHPT